MSGVTPASRFENYGVQQTDAEHFPANSIDLDPVAGLDAVRAHQNKPAEKADDEIFHGDGNAGAGERRDGRKIIGKP